MKWCVLKNGATFSTNHSLERLSFKFRNRNCIRRLTFRWIYRNANVSWGKILILFQSTEDQSIIIASILPWCISWFCPVLCKKFGRHIYLRSKNVISRWTMNRCICEIPSNTSSKRMFSIKTELNIFGGLCVFVRAIIACVKTSTLFYGRIHEELAKWRFLVNDIGRVSFGHFVLLLFWSGQMKWNFLDHKPYQFVRIEITTAFLWNNLRFTRKEHRTDFGHYYFNQANGWWMHCKVHLILQTCSIAIECKLTADVGGIQCKWFDVIFFECETEYRTFWMWMSVFLFPCVSCGNQVLKIEFYHSRT